MIKLMCNYNLLFINLTSTYIEYDCRKNKIVTDKTYTTLIKINLKHLIVHMKVSSFSTVSANRVSQLSCSPLRFAILAAIPICPTLGSFRALIRTIQLGSPHILTQSSWRSQAAMTSLRKVDGSIFLRLVWLSPKTSPSSWIWLFSISCRYPVISTRSGISESRGGTQSKVVGFVLVAGMNCKRVHYTADIIN